MKIQLVPLLPDASKFLINPIVPATLRLVPQGPTGAPGAQGIPGIQGVQGFAGWAPLYVVETSGAKSALKIFDWIGGGGSKPETGQYLGSAGVVLTFADAANVQGATGAAGLNAWTAIEAIVADGARRVRRILDWFGGTGTKPAAGMYIGATGFVTDIADATDIRGIVGAGVPVGGLPGQYLVKLSGTDFDVGWATLTINNAALDALQWRLLAR